MTTHLSIASCRLCLISILIVLLCFTVRLGCAGHAHAGHGKKPVVAQQPFVPPASKHQVRFLGKTYDPAEWLRIKATLQCIYASGKWIKNIKPDPLYKQAVDKICDLKDSRYSKGNCSTAPYLAHSAKYAWDFSKCDGTGK